METDVLKRYSAAEVALLGLFALGLFLAMLIVQVRGRVELDAPVALSTSGLSAPLPKGAGWESAGGWRYESDNAYVLLAMMRVRQQAIIHVRWRYTLCDEPMDPQTGLKALAERAGGQILDVGQVDGPIPMRYCRIFTPSEGGQEFLFGVMPLDFGRQLELNVTYRSDPGFAETVFQTLAVGVVYQRSAELAAGAERVGAFFSSAGADVNEVNNSQEKAFIIQDMRERPMGYVVNRHYAHTDSSEHHVRVTSRQFEPTGMYTESDLWVTPSDATFSWTMKFWSPRAARPQTTALRADVQQISIKTDTDSDRTLQRSPLLLPEPLLVSFAAALPKAPDDTIIQNETVLVDVLTGEGYVVPTRLRRVPVAQSHVHLDADVSIVRVDYLHMDESFDEMIFDAQGQYIGRYEQQPGRPARLWEATTDQRLRSIFGDRLEPRTRQAVRLDSPGGEIRMYQSERTITYGKG